MTMTRGGNVEGLAHLAGEMEAAAASLRRVRVSVIIHAPTASARLAEVEQWLLDRERDLVYRRRMLEELPDMTGITAMLRREAWLVELVAPVPAVVGGAVGEAFGWAGSALVVAGDHTGPARPTVERPAAVGAVVADGLGGAARVVGERATALLRTGARTLERLAR